MRIGFVSLGCDKNLVDSEKMAGQLAERGYEFTDDIGQADVAIVNTCCFIGDAKEESVRSLLELAEEKKRGKLRALIVCGCLAQRYRDQVKKEIPEVDAIVGVTAIDEIVSAVEEALAGQGREHLQSVHRRVGDGLPRSQAFGSHYAYLKIAEGCDKRCTYCIIPSLRGKYRSFPMEALVEEARALASGGARELILVAQETTLYGIDLYGRRMLPELLTALCAVDGLRWIRLLYCYPEEITDGLIAVMKREPKICHYLDLPIQHVSDRILEAMGRRTRRGELEEILRKLRGEIPDICLRTTLITGFPGESRREHEELMDFVGAQSFDRLGVFCYSREEGTPAASFPGQIPERVKRRRRDDLMALQQGIAFSKAKEMVGKRLQVMVEGRVADGSGDNAYVARTYRDAPEVDGALFLETERELESGALVWARVTGSRGYDLLGELEDEKVEFAE